jgi:hypothetical protein
MQLSQALAVLPPTAFAAFLLEQLITITHKTETIKLFMCVFFGLNLNYEFGFLFYLLFFW